MFGLHKNAAEHLLRSVPAPEVGVQGQSVKRPISKSELETGEAQKVEIKK